MQEGAKHGCSKMMGQLGIPDVRLPRLDDMKYRGGFDL
jgi:hypothetical protein